MNSPPSSYGTTRNRPASVSFAEIEAAALKLMTAGDYPSNGAVRKLLARGSSTTINEAMQRFWKNQAALSAGNPIALTRLPPEFADAAVELWEQALRLSLQTAKADDNAAQATLQELNRDLAARSRSVELREREWDMAARVRERALTDAREQVNVLLQELATDRAELRSRSVRIAELETQLEDHRRQLTTLIARAVEKNRAARSAKATPHTGARREAERARGPKRRSAKGRQRPKPKKLRRR